MACATKGLHGGADRDQQRDDRGKHAGALHRRSALLAALPAPPTHTHTTTQPHTHTHTHTHTNTYTQAHTNTHKHTHTQTHPNTHIHTLNVRAFGAAPPIFSYSAAATISHTALLLPQGTSRRSLPARTPPVWSLRTTRSSLDALSCLTIVLESAGVLRRRWWSRAVVDTENMFCILSARTQPHSPRNQLNRLHFCSCRHESAHDREMSSPDLS